MCFCWSKFCFRPLPNLLVFDDGRGAGNFGGHLLSVLWLWASSTVNSFSSLKRMLSKRAWRWRNLWHHWSCYLLFLLLRSSAFCSLESRSFRLTLAIGWTHSRGIPILFGMLFLIEKFGFILRTLRWALESALSWMGTISAVSSTAASMAKLLIVHAKLDLIVHLKLDVFRPRIDFGIC